VPGDMGTPESRYHGYALTAATVALIGRGRRRRLGEGQPAGTLSSGGARGSYLNRCERAEAGRAAEGALQNTQSQPHVSDRTARA
jgi:hypothetical protein